jgi:hypothetical protein
MTQARATAALFLALESGVLPPAAARAQHASEPAAAEAAARTETTDTIAHFLARARAGTRRYRDRAAAIADGYRLIGPDFPGMGEHWIHLALVMRREFDAARPPVLEYATIRGVPTLIGVAYVLPLLRGESPPHFPPTHAWHDHTETVDEESVLIDQVASSHSSTAGARLAMLHAWVWLDNPAGPFDSDNWSLPFARIGLAPPRASPTPSAGRALSLMSGGDTFYTALLQALGRPSAADSTNIRETLTSARREVAALVRQHGAGPISDREMSRLGDLWMQVWQTLETTLDPAVRERLRPVWQKR